MCLPRRRSPVEFPLASVLISTVVACAATPESMPSSPMPRRVAAEWEPALGVLVHWPPYLPRDLFVELARDAHLYVLVDGAEPRASAETWFGRWGIAPEDATFLTVPASDDAAWTRDFGPHPIFTASGELVLGDARYDRSTPDSELACDAPLKTPWNGGWGGRFPDYDATQEDAAPTRIADALGVRAHALPFVLTGGNFLTDGRGLALSSCILTNENRDNGVPEERFFELAREHLGVTRYTVVPNFENEGIQHVDCLFKLLDANRILVARPPRAHPLFERYERLVNEHLAPLVTSSGHPFEILRIDTAPYAEDRLAAYTNSLILNGVVYVPLFGIPQDEVALGQWQAALPGHEVKGFPFVLADEPALPDRARRMYPDGIGWRNFDALHCRTRAVWDANMLHVSVDPIADRAAPAEGYEVVASIVAYGAESIDAEGTRVMWRRAGTATWSTAPMDRGEDGRFSARLTAGTDPGVVEYYVRAEDTGGRVESNPRTAPRAHHRFEIGRPGDR